MPPAFVTYQKIRWRYIGLADGQPSQERYALLRLCQVLDSHAAEIQSVISGHVSSGLGSSECLVINGFLTDRGRTAVTV